MGRSSLCHLKWHAIYNTHKYVCMCVLCTCTELTYTYEKNERYTHCAEANFQIKFTEKNQIIMHTIFQKQQQQSYHQALQKEKESTNLFTLKNFVRYIQFILFAAVFRFNHHSFSTFPAFVIASIYLLHLSCSSSQ